MKYLIIFLLILIFILFLPIPIKIKIYYCRETYFLKFYNITLFSDKGGIINKLLIKDKKNSSESDNTNIKRNKNKKERKHLNFNLSSLRKVYYKLQCNRFKPSLKFTLYSEYDLNNAAITSIIYGILSNLNVILYKIFTDFFNLKKLNLSFNPKFNDILNINITINSIITFNIAQIIYMLFLVKHNLKEVPLE